MTTVFILVAMYGMINPITGNQTSLNIETMAFQTAERCLRNLEANQGKLNKEYSFVQMQCLKKKVEPGK